MASGEGLQANQAGGDRLEVGGEWEGVTEWEWERRKRVAAEWWCKMGNMGIGFFKKTYIYIYIGGFFSIFNLYICIYIS